MMKSVKNSKNDLIEKKQKMNFFIKKKLFGIVTVINFKNY